MNNDVPQEKQLTVKATLSLAKKMTKKHNYAAALGLYSAVLQQEPKNPVAKKGLRRTQTAIDSGNAENKAADPSSEEMNTLVSLYQSGHMAEVEQQCKLSLVNYPQSSIVMNLLAAAQGAQGRMEEAVNSYRKAIQMNPSFAEAYCNCGVALKKLGRFEEALQSYNKAIHLKPNYPDAFSNRGVLLQELGDWDQALFSHNKAIQLDPYSATAYFNLGIVWKEKGHLAVAALNFKKATELQYDFVGAICNYGLVLQELGFISQALEHYHKAVKIEPNFAEAHGNLGTLFQELGRLKDSLNSYKKAIQLQPDYLAAYSNLLMLQNYLPPDLTNNSFQMALEYGKIVTESSAPKLNVKKETQTLAKLRVGFVSGDLHNHPVGYFLESFLRSVDKSRLELFAYPTTLIFDSLSERIKPHFASWKSLKSKTDLESAELIAADGIHVLIDLAGHTQNNRLPVFAFRPSPIQVTWLGYFATTGLDEIDYFLGDHHVTPVESNESFSESVWRLPRSRWCYTQPDIDIEVSELPALRNGYITFGCFGNLSKINDSVVELWCKILRAIPDSRLILKSFQFKDLAVRQVLVDRFGELGVSQNRVKIEGPDNRYNYFESFRQIDITLDTFPFSGGTTSVDSLWMGVPIITLLGDSLVSRQGVGILASTDMQNWIAADEKDYVTKAISFASRINYLAELRTGLRPKVLSSPLFDAPQFARDIEDALWAMWSRKV